MKDEEMAKRFADSHTHYEVAKREDGTEYAKKVSDITIQQAFLAGLKAGRPQWHDLRKDPNDLPKEENRIMLCYCCIGYHGNIGAYVYRLYTKKEFHKVIAWCEIPAFDKE